MLRHAVLDFTQHFPPLSIAPGIYTRHARDMADDFSTQRERWYADRLAEFQLRDLSVKTEVLYDLINGYCEYRKHMNPRERKKMREVIVPAAAKYFGVSQKTVYNARREVKARREAEEAHTKAVEDQLAAMKRKTLQP
jgi:hypothetical protein